jgi:hypothetical protein
MRISLGLGRPVRMALAAVLLALGLASAPALAQTACSPTSAHLCLQGSRFQAEVSWSVPGLGSGVGQAVPLTADTGYFWFFSSSNVELVVKVLDGRAVNGHFWVFHGGLSDVAYTLTVTDVLTGAREVFDNPRGQLVSAADVAAFLPEPSTGATARTAPLAAGAAPPQETPARAGAEIPLNVVAAGNQVLPAVAVAPDGSFMTVWSREPLPQDGTADVFGRVFDAAGNPRTGEIRLSDTPLLGYQPRARVAASSTGEFMAVWSADEPTPTRAQARLYGPGGQPIGGLIQLASSSSVGIPRISAPDVTADPSGGFLTAWTEYGVPGSSSIVTQRFDAQGNPLGNPVAFSAQFSSEAPRLTAFRAGGFLVVWPAVYSSIDSFTSDLGAQRLDASGQTVGVPFLLNPDDRFLPGRVMLAAPVAYADGGFSVLWTHATLYGYVLDGLFARRFAADGTPAGGIAHIQPNPSATTSPPAAVPLPSGDTWILWNNNAALADSGIYSGVFDRAWTLQGGVARVNAISSLSGETDPAVALAGTNAVAVWSDGPLFIIIDPPPPGLSGSGVFAQRFTLPTCAISSGQLCLDGRFRVEVRFTDPRNGQASSGTPVPLTSDTGTFWFFSPANLELVVKVLDGRDVNGHFWVFYGALSDVEYTITVTDSLTGSQRAYHNNAHTLASRADVAAFTGLPED